MAHSARRSIVVLVQAALLATMLAMPAVVRAADATTTTLVSNLNPSLRGENVTFTATVRLADGTPATVVTVRFGRGSSCGPGFTQLQAARAVNANGVVTFITGAIALGTTAIWGCYDGVAGQTSSSVASVNQRVVSALPTLLSVAPASGFFGGTADLSATLTISGRGTPVGAVSISFSLNGGTALTGTTNASGVATVSGASLAGIGSGTYPSGVAASFAGTATRLASTGSGALTVGPAQEEHLPTVTTVTCPAGPFTYSGAAITPCSVTVTASDGLGLTPDPVYTANVAAGTATASYVYAGDATHDGSSDSATFEIGQATLAVNAQPGSKTYGGPEPSLGWAYSGFVHGEDATSAGVTGTADCERAPGETVAGGPYAITCAPGSLAAANYAFEPGLAAAFTIDPADAVCDVGGFDGTYDGSPHGATGTCTGVSGEDLSTGLDLGRSFTDAPGGTASWSFAADNYRPQSGEADIAIARAPSDVAVTCPDAVTFTGLPQTPCSASVTGAGGLDQALDVDYANNVLGTATATATFTGDANHDGDAASTTFLVAYAWSGFLQPVNDTGHEGVGAESRFHLGQTIPAKFVLADAFGNVVTQAEDPTFSRSANRGSCDDTTVAESVPDVDPSDGATFEWTGGQYHFNWSTKGLATGEYRIFANLADGTRRSVDICLTR